MRCFSLTHSFGVNLFSHYGNYGLKKQETLFSGMVQNQGRFIERSIGLTHECYRDMDGQTLS